MKVIRLSTRGVEPAQPKLISTSRGKCWAFCHGQEGRGRWQWRALLGVRDFPVDDTDPTPPPPDQDYKPLWLESKDAKGNRHLILLKGEEDSTILVLWDLSPGFRGGASHRVSGKAVEVGFGRVAEGLAGGMGGAACPVVLVEGPCQLEWTRTGRLYGDYADWVATYNGEVWLVSPKSACPQEEAAFA